MARLIDADKADVENISCYYGSNCYVEDVQAWLDEQPTVDAVPVVHGRWIEKIDIVASYFAECEEFFYECSACNSANFGESPYCPHCGAKMDLEVE